MDRANHLHAVAQARQDGQSQRAAVSGAGVARSTLRHWNAPPAIAAPAALAAFVETPEGVVWLRRILVAAHWSIGEQGGAGVRVVCDFSKRSGLSAFIGASYGAQQGLPDRLGGADRHRCHRTARDAGSSHAPSHTEHRRR
ncbi:hypothetical protein [Thiocapsa sp.]|uniref:hypothetical protein n=1 Tax=Thiocapsa sp. TaxID=2024551 RepID=UPI001BD11354|nr:hypothetical protein [Thiocapsa sp.]